jgi:hypothetical protein
MNSNHGGNQQARMQAGNPCPPLAGHANNTWGNCNMNAYSSNCRQVQPCDAHNVEQQVANPQAVPPQPRAAGGSNLSCNSLNHPACGTTFQEPADAGYKSYFSEFHPVYHDRPESFFSGQEFEPEMHEPLVEKFPVPPNGYSAIDGDRNSNGRPSSQN